MTTTTWQKKKILHKIALLLLWLDIFGLSIHSPSKRFGASLVSAKCVWWPVFVFIRLLCVFVCVFECVSIHCLFGMNFEDSERNIKWKRLWKRLRSLFAFFCAIYHSLNLLLAHIIDMLGFCITLHDDRHNTKHEHRAYYLLFIAVYSIPFYSWRRNCLFLQFSFGSFWASVGWFFFLLRFDDYYFVLDCHSECKHSSQFRARYVRKSECVCAVLSPYFHLQYDGICHRNWT